jgi:uncharacterized membrane protein YsdA (DUF1294 family)
MQLPQWILIAGALYLPMSVVTALVYRVDKLRARAAGAGAAVRRVPERTLHLLELCGGWPGALWARGHFRHKTRDRAFAAWFWAIGLAHALAWVACARLS